MSASANGRVPTGFASEIIISDASFRSAHRAVEASSHASKKRKREQRGDTSVVYGKNAYKGPWARFDEERPDADSDDAAAADDDDNGDDDDDDDDADDADVVVVYDEDAIEPQPAAPQSKAGTAYAAAAAGPGGRDSSTFHGASLHDYQGRTYMHVPLDLGVDLTGDASGLKNYTPKKQVHAWRASGALTGGGSSSGGGTGGGAGKPVTQLRFFPGSGHLLLTAAADASVRLFDVYHERELLRSFAGHARSVNDICFNDGAGVARDPLEPVGAGGAPGTRFLTASYDRYMKLWDTETGACLGRFTSGKTPLVVRFNPTAPLGHEFVAGMSDKKILQFDSRVGNADGGGGSSGGGGGARGSAAADPDAAVIGGMVQEYDHHLGPVNTLTFCDQGRRFVSTSDDKSLRAWEYGIPVPIKFIAEPHMFSMVRAAAHPAGKFIAFQSGDNQIVVYASTDRFRQNRKKGFRGHNNAGYAIDLDFSPDGQILMSGDSAGFVCFWDWRSCKMWHKIQASDTPIVACQWHPRETSKVVTGDLNGVVKYWD